VLARTAHGDVARPCHEPPLRPRLCCRIWPRRRGLERGDRSG
ncbi:unnamed protein product, partial [Acidocella sp. C78]